MSHCWAPVQEETHTLDNAKNTRGGDRTHNLRLRKPTRFHCATRACKSGSWSCWGSNPGPSPYQSDALPTELHDPVISSNHFRQGGVAQMVERSLSMREVQGSIPCISTFCICGGKNCRGCSSNGRALAQHARGTGIDTLHLHFLVSKSQRPERHCGRRNLASLRLPHSGSVV
jgi:hypothetical protein